MGSVSSPRLHNYLVTSEIGFLIRSIWFQSTWFILSPSKTLFNNLFLLWFFQHLYSETSSASCFYFVLFATLSFWLNSPIELVFSLKGIDITILTSVHFLFLWVVLDSWKILSKCYQMNKINVNSLWLFQKRYN